MTVENAPSRRLLGAALMVASVAFFVTMNALTKKCDIPAAEKVMYRMAVGVFAIFAMIRLGFVRMEMNNLRLLVLRGVLGAFAVMSYFYAIDHTTLGRAVFFQFTYPAWGSLFSAVFLRESMGWKRSPALALTFLGAFLILAFPHGGEEAATKAGDLAGVLCGIFSGAAVTTIRGLHRTDGTYIIFLFFAAFGAMFGAGTTFASHAYVAPSHFEWLLLAGIGVTGTVAQLFFTAGYRYLDVTAAGAMAMMQAPLSAFAGFLFFEEGLSHVALFGAALVLAGGIILACTSRGAVLRPSE